MENWAERLFELRMEKGAKQAVVGDFVGVSQSRISQYEHGVTIASDVLILLADFFEVSADYLLGRSDIKNPIPYSTLSDEDNDIFALVKQLSPEQKKVLKGVIVGIKLTIKK